MAKLKIYRERNWTSRIDQPDIYLNGEKIGRTHYGETNEFDVTPGSHRLQVKFNSAWGGSKEFQFNMFTKDMKTFCIERNKIISYGFLILLLGLVLLKRYIVIAIITLIIRTKGWSTAVNVEDSLQSVIYTAIYILLVVCFLFIGRKSYFKIKEAGQE